MTTLLPHIELTSGPNPDAAVIWLHGLGADGNDFAAIVPELDLAGCRPIRFIFPHAPSMPVTINGGYVMPAWYDIVGTDLQKREDAAGIRRSALAIEALIAHEMARGVDARRIVLAGFSQGCAIALHTGLRHAAPLAGIMALSGYLPPANMFGAIVGDIAGPTYERCNLKSESCPVFARGSCFTDDTVLTLATADHFIFEGSYEKVYREFGRDYPHAGYGASFRNWMLSESPEPYNSWGNGSAMRVSPIGWVAEDLQWAIEEAGRSAEVTHNHPNGIKGAKAVAAAIFSARMARRRRS